LYKDKSLTENQEEHNFNLNKVNEKNGLDTPPDDESELANYNTIAHEYTNEFDSTVSLDETFTNFVVWCHHVETTTIMVGDKKT